MRGGNPGPIFRMTYNRNTVNVDDAVAQLRRRRAQIKAVVLAATFRPAAKFIEKTRDAYPDMIYAAISGVGSTGLSDELTLLGPRFANRPGGYLRILKFGFRVGDNAPMALVELMDRPEVEEVEVQEAE